MAKIKCVWLPPYPVGEFRQPVRDQIRCGLHANFFLKMTRPITERTILTEMINIYRDNPCLWDPDNKHYSNKFFREKAFKLILEKYKQLDEDACIKTVKKKIEFMRAVYRREFIKVLSANEAGDEYEPKLWYYDHMSFLSNVLQCVRLKNPLMGTTPKKDIAHVEVNQTASDDEPEAKRLKISFSSDDPDENDEADKSDAEDESEVVHEVQGSSSKRKYITGSATKAPIVFGRALGLQLMELQPIQRYIAEKLISDVIYFGRMEKLNLDTCININ